MLAQMFDSADLDGSGVIDFHEFLELERRRREGSLSLITMASANSSSLITMASANSCRKSRCARLGAQDLSALAISATSSSSCRPVTSGFLAPGDAPSRETCRDDNILLYYYTIVIMSPRASSRRGNRMHPAARPAAMRLDYYTRILLYDYILDAPCRETCRDEIILLLLYSMIIMIFLMTCRETCRDEII